MADSVVDLTQLKSENGMNNGRDSPRDRSRSPVGARARKSASRSRSRSPRDWKRSERNRSSGRDRDRGGRPSRWSGTANSGGGGSRDGKVRLYVSNIPYEVRWQDLKDIFKNEVGNEVTYVEMYDGPDGKSSGAAVVEVRTRDAAEKAIEKMHKHDVKGRKIIVREEREKDRLRHKAGGGGGGGGGGGMNDMNNSMGGGGGGGGMGGMGMGGNMGGGMGGNMGGMGMSNMGGMSGGGGGGGGMASLPNGITPQILQQYGIDPDNITNQVFVANLDYKVTSRKLREIFKMAGNVQSAEIKEDKDGKSRGMGIVKFEHPMEAVQAISMFHNQILYDRTMTVKMDKHGDHALTAQQIPNRLPSGLKGIGMGLGQGGTPINVGQLGGGAPTGGMGGNSLGGMGMGGGLGMGGGMGAGGMNTAMGSMGGSLGGMSTMGSSMGSNMGMGSTGMGNMGSSMGSTGMGGMGSMSSGLGGMGNSSMGSSAMGGFSDLGGMGMGSSSLGMAGDMGSSSMGLGSFGSMGSSLSSTTGLSNMGGLDSLAGGMGGSSSSLGMRSSSLGSSSRAGMGGMGGMGGGGSNRSSTGGMGGALEESCTIFVRNLPFTLSWQNLRDQFKDCGDVKFAELKTDENGRSKGYGTVRFGTPEDARRAVNLMNGTRIQGRQVEVRLNKV